MLPVASRFEDGQAVGEDEFYIDARRSAKLMLVISLIPWLDPMFPVL